MLGDTFREGQLQQKYVKLLEGFSLVGFVCLILSLFTRSVNVTVFCEVPLIFLTSCFLNGTKTVTLTVRVNEAFKKQKGGNPTRKLTHAAEYGRHIGLGGPAEVGAGSALLELVGSDDVLVTMVTLDGAAFRGDALLSDAD